MKEELTREVLEALKGCKEKDDCDLCPSSDFCNRKDTFEREALLATALIEEMDKPKVWDGAPEWATEALVAFFNKDEHLNHVCKNYTRELPKTRARQIAEKEGRGLTEKYGWNAAAKELVTNVIESALEKYAAELGTAT